MTECKSKTEYQVIQNLRINSRGAQEVLLLAKQQFYSRVLPLKWVPRSNSWFYTIYLLAEINEIGTFQEEDIKMERKTIGEREGIAIILIKTHYTYV